MLYLRTFFLILGLLALPALPATAAPTPNEPEEGAVVEEAARGWAAERAGLQPGDLVTSWVRGEGNGGPVRSSFDLARLEIEQAPLGGVRLRGSRQGEAREWLLPPGEWRMKARPVEAAGRREDPLRAAWLEARQVQQLAEAGRWAEADAALERAVQGLEKVRPATAALDLVQILGTRDWTGTPDQSSLLDRIEKLLGQALAQEPADSLASAWALLGSGMIAADHGRLPEAESFFRRAIALQEKLAPGSADQVRGLEGLAMVARRRGDLGIAEEHLAKALDIQSRLAPESFDFAALLNHLGAVALNRGDLSLAEERMRRALALAERLNPEGPELAEVLLVLGRVNLNRGDLAAAEEHLRRALALLEHLAPEGLGMAANLNALGDVAGKRGDFTVSQELHRRALQILEKMARASPPASDVNVYYLYNLAAVEKRAGNLEKADQHLQRILEIQEANIPDSFYTAATYYQRALIAMERGDLALAEQLHSRALAIDEKNSSGGLAISDHLGGLGAVAIERNDLARARELLQRALAIREKMAPGSTRVGQTLHQLGQVDRREGRLAMSAEHFCRATEAFDQQRLKLGGTTEGKSAFSGTMAEPYRDCLAALVDIGRPEEAFRTLERGRARLFLDLLAERDLQWTADLPPELVQERKLTDAEYDRTQAALDRLSPEQDQAEVDRLLVRLRELRARQDEIAAKIRQSSPRASALQDPQPLDLAGARAALDPGTVLLAWSIGQERSFLFVVQPAGTEPGLEVFPLPLTDRDLRRRVESFRNLLQHADSDRAALTRQARELYDALLRPADARIAGARRILVSPDGPLHTLPFAALLRKGRWLAEQKPLHTVLSATVYAEIQKSRRESPDAAPAVLAAFGNPRYPSQPGRTSGTDPEVRAAFERGLSLDPLPFSGEEVRDIASLYPAARTFLGTEATEERAKSIGKAARYLHFACHGLLDERFPLNSALALTIPEHPGAGQDNGLLQAWEIFESVRLDADLVTLSACDSALGQEMGGEGLLGLTRAFQYAGARSVLGSLWSINDRSTGNLMTRFYRHLRAGTSKDEALRAAQAELIHTPHFSHPYYWAAFELAGDWR